MTISLALPLVVILTAAAATAQPVTVGRPGQVPGPRTGPRDTMAPTTGTARLRGRVVGGETGQALRRAVVRLQAQEFRESRMASTDEDGRWEIKDLPAGRYTLSAFKGGYVQLNYGQRRPFERGRPIELADGQTLEHVDFNLPRGSVISGRIVDEFGDPVADASVAAMRYHYMNGRRRLMPAGRFASTDDTGHFRLFGLAPGDYYVSATLRPMGMFSMEDSSDNTVGYAPTFYPGTPSASQADRVAVGVGAEVPGVTFSLLPVRTVKVSGTAVDSSGKPMAGAFVMLRAESRGTGGMMMFGGGGGRVRDDGTFTIANVTPGDYVVQVMPMMGMGRQEEPETAIAEIAVGGEDVDGVVLTGTKGTVIRGQVVVHPAAAATGIKASDVSVSVLAKDPDAPASWAGGGFREGLEDDWSFEVRAFQSPVVLRTFRVPPGYSLKAVLNNGVDVTDTGIAFKPNEPVSGLQVVITTTGSSVSGTVTADDGRPVSDYAVLLYAEDPSKWGFMSRHISVARPDQQGGFLARNLPAGRYLAVAIDAVEDGQETDPELLERLRTLATPFGLTEGEQRALTLKLVQAY